MWEIYIYIHISKLRVQAHHTTIPTANEALIRFLNMKTHAHQYQSPFQHIQHTWLGLSQVLDVGSCSQHIS